MKPEPSPANPLIQVLKLLMADPSLRRSFITDPGQVFSQLGLGCPADFVGRRGNHCPVMPPLPTGEAANDIRHPYWQTWLEGSLEQLRNARVVLANETPFPARSSFTNEAEWQAFVEEVRQTIQQSINEWHRAESRLDPEPAASVDQSVHQQDGVPAPPTADAAPAAEP